jgi:hypothetical protein
MRRRITYIQPPHAPFHPSQTTLSPNTLTISNLDAAREERITLGFDELSGEVCLLSPSSRYAFPITMLLLFDRMGIIADSLRLENSFGRY